MSEREQIVAWIRSEAAELLADEAEKAAEALLEAADAIVDGEHLERPKPKEWR